MKVNSVSQYVTPKTTGYAAAASTGLAVLSGVTKNKSIKKTHSCFAFSSALLTILHIGLIEYYHYKYRGK